MEKSYLEGVEYFIELINNEPLWLLFIPIIIITSMLLKAKSIINLLDELKKSKLENISNALDCKYIDGLTKAHLKDEIVNEHFYLSTGIGVEKNIREAILKAYFDTNQNLSFTHYKRALKHLKYEKNENGEVSLKIKIKKYDKCLNLFLAFYSLIMGVLGLLLILMVPISHGLSFVQYLVIIGIGLLFIFFAMLTYSQTFSFASAVKIKDELEKIKKLNKT